MTQPNLLNQLAKQYQQLKNSIDRLDDSDPMKLWFESESRQMQPIADATLEQTNGKLRALRQLQHLLFEHCVKLQNEIRLDEGDETLPVSYLSQKAKIPANVLELAKEKRFSIEPSLLFAKDWDNEQFDPVSPTAKIVGYLRSRDPSLRIAPQLLMDEEGRNLLHQLSSVDETTITLMAALFQSRYHTINAAIARSNAPQIIELASGVSPRGLQWARSMAETIFVETDLPALMIHKAKLLRNHILDSDELNRGILHCAAVDVLNFESLRSALNFVDVDVPFVLVSEGLLLYLNEQELSVFLDQISLILKEHPRAIWVADFVTKTNLKELLESYPGVASAVKKVFSMTGRNVIVKNSFDSDQCIADMLSANGLEILYRDSLQLMQKIRDPDSTTDILGLLGGRNIWTVRTACGQNG